MFRDRLIESEQESPVVERLRAVRNYLRSIHAACLNAAVPCPGHVLAIDDESGWGAAVSPGGYTLVAQVGGDALLCPIQLSCRGELEYSDRLVVVPIGSLSSEMIVGRETMIIPE